MENIFGAHILIRTWDSKIVIGEFTVHREDGQYTIRMPCDKWYDAGKHTVSEPRKRWLSHNRSAWSR